MAELSEPEPPLPLVGTNAVIQVLPPPLSVDVAPPKAKQKDSSDQMIHSSPITEHDQSNIVEQESLGADSGADMNGDDTTMEPSWTEEDDRTAAREILLTESGNELDEEFQGPHNWRTKLRSTKSKRERPPKPLTLASDDEKEDNDSDSTGLRISVPGSQSSLSNDPSPRLEERETELDTVDR